ncbi:MAG: CbtA family protein [Rhodospirillales bacterium]|nr:CbtA family protein [Rhodospirillales bacterium]MBO6786053.1 CbtA family protein [Rhodospirillales bacterium]
MIGRILLAAVAAGLIAGAFVSGAQMLKVVPLIYAAEAYEAPAPGAETHSHDNATADHSHDHGAAYMPDDGFERIGLTALTNIVLGAGFALLIAAGMTLRGRATNWRLGLIWGAAGFLSFSFLPALGLPPELPGMAAADLTGRQLWWVMTVAASAGGLALIAFSPNWPLRFLGAAMLSIPHLVGAPHPHEFSGGVPAELAAQFVATSLVTAGLFWLLLGALTGHFIGRGLQQD